MFDGKQANESMGFVKNYFDQLKPIACAIDQDHPPLGAASLDCRESPGPQAWAIVVAMQDAEAVTAQQACDGSLSNLSPASWEALCDGCGRCCLIKLQDEDTDRVFYTDVACRLLDLHSCRCGQYAHRTRHVPDCVVLEPEAVAALIWMPSTCAYRLRAQSQPLPDWHPLISGDPESVHRAGISVRGRVKPEGSVAEDDLCDHVVGWPE